MAKLSKDQACWVEEKTKEIAALPREAQMIALAFLSDPTFRFAYQLGLTARK